MEAKDFSALRISLASPDQIESWSYGEVTKPETINYRRLRPEKDGLFCEAIFGPTRDYQCYCGKYKNIRYKGIVCDKCGVEVTKSSVRRERMGHIKLAAPVAHVWYTRRVPSYLGLLLDVSRRNLDRVLYFAQYVVTNVDEEARNKALERLNDERARQERDLVGDLDEQIRALREQRDTEFGSVENRVGQLDDTFNQERDRLSEEIVTEAQRLEQRIKNLMGQPVPEDIYFTKTDTKIAGKGEVADHTHIQFIQDEVTASLNDLQALIEERRIGEQQLIEREVDERSSTYIDQIRALEAERITRLSQLGGKIDDVRRELTDLHTLQFVSEPRYRELRQRYGQVFKADMGAEALLEILKHMDLERLAVELWDEVKTTRSKQKRKKATKRLKVIESLRKSNNRPEWMILTVLPVIPPDLRPMVQLDGGRFATSDLNDLYRRVINRNNRLKRLLELGAPDVIVRNEKRMLQEAVDSLIDNSQRGKALSRRGRRELKSLSDMLKGKKGRFRRNLLGKRVDYSGRSVIVIGPRLKLHQCGLPKMMALELFRPFVIAKLVAYNYASNVKSAKRIIERERPEVWEVLEEVIKERPVLLNRAPTLHRLGIQAFEAQLVEGKAIQIHPLVCAAFNADFDGDQMAVHVPLSDKAVKEARELMLSTKNLLKPADGSPVVAPSKDMVLGNYYLTMDPTAEIVCKPARSEEFRTWAALREGRYKIGVIFNSAGERQIEHRDLDLNNEVFVFRNLVEYDADGRKKTTKAEDIAFAALKDGEIDVLVHNAQDTLKYARKKKLDVDLANLGERQVVVDLDEVEHLYALGLVNLHTPILLGNYYDNPDRQPPAQPEICTIGRAIFNRILPDEIRFVQEIQDKKNLQKLVSEVHQIMGMEQTTEVVDQIKNLGFYYATISGTTIAVSDLTVPLERETILATAENQVDGYNRSFRRGLMTEQERYLRTVSSWNDAKDKLQDVIKENIDPFGPVAVMAISGSTKGGFGPITQLAGMRGLMADPSGRIIDLPIRSNFRQGLTAQEYFISTHGARKGLADTALRTADAGYLTRRLVDVAQDVIVNRLDCGTKAGLWVPNPTHPSHLPHLDPDADIAGQSFQERIVGRCAARPIYHPETGELMVDRNEIISEEVADEMAAVKVEYANVRSPMTCALIHGICSYCYGRDLGRGELVALGAAVGIVAAQSIGEPGTQLTLRTFHTGGTAQASGDITTGLPRVEELFEARKKPKGEAVMVDMGGYMSVERRDDGVRVAKVSRSEVFKEEHDIPFGWDVMVESDQEIKEKQILAQQVGGEGDGILVSKMGGIVYIEGHKLYIRYEKTVEKEYEIPSSSRLRDEIEEAIKASPAGVIEVDPGTQLTDGSKNPHQILRVLGEDHTQRYLLREVQDVYRNQGVNISDKHFEVIIRKMLSKVAITRSGESGILPGELIDKLKLLDLNEKLIAQGLEPAAGVPVLLGVTKAALSTDSFLAASSFQHTIKVLAGAAIEGKEDRLYGLKENVIIGKLIASGTGFHTYQDREMTVPDLTLAAQGALDTAILDDDEDDVDEYDELEESLTKSAFDEEDADADDDDDADADADETDEEEELPAGDDDDDEFFGMSMMDESEGI